MQVNPYSAAAKRKIAVASRTGQPLFEGGSEVPRGSFGKTDGGTSRRSNMPLVASNGEFNATNKTEVMQAIQTLHTLFAAGEVTSAYSNDPNELLEVRAARARRLEEAYADRTGQAWQALGEVIGDEIWQTLGQLTAPAYA